MNRNMSVVLAYDLGLYCALILWIYFDSRGSGPLGILIPVAIAFFAIWAGKGIQTAVAGLSQRQKKLRFSFGIVLFGLLLALALRWMLRANSAAAWSIGSLGLVILSTLQYAEWDRLQDELRKAPPPPSGEC